MENFRYFLFLAYNGSGFHGWQEQPNAHTIQAEIQYVLKVLTGNPCQLTGAGRTDTGVHARRFYAHFDSDKLINEVELSQLVYKLNRFLPQSIVIYDIFRVKPNVHARFSAISRTYHYYISRRKDPFSNDQSWIYTPELDIEKMEYAAGIIKDYSDFSCFSKSRTQTLTNDCNIYESFFISQDHFLIYHVKANRFLRNMVRAIVGTLMEVGKDNISMDELRTILEKGSRSDAGMSVPACGLFLEDVEYPEDIRIRP
ncbi:MAG: tRNA pseudouridine(38-40) synthase TruA [Bacteroidota bacterium]